MLLVEINEKYFPYNNGYKTCKYCGCEPQFHFINKLEVHTYRRKEEIPKISQMNKIGKCFKSLNLL